jgi:hypothetical protein
MNLFSVDPPRKSMTKWVMLAALGFVALVATFLLLTACAGPAVGRERLLPVKLIEFEIKTESGKVISRVRTWEYENTDRNPDPVPATR